MVRIDDTLRLGRQIAELNAVVPGIVSDRLTRFAWAGPAPSRADRAEFARMSSEKWRAASQSMMAMSAFALELQLSAAQAFWQAALSPWLGAPAAPRPTGDDPVVGMLSAGLAPYHRIATANARRLRKR